MKLGIMQPYFFPYIGYWQLLNAVDKYVIYDDVNFIKGGWINRNKILMNGEAKMFNVQMQGASPNKLINEIEVSTNEQGQKKLLRSIENNYRKAPYFKDVYNILEEIIMSKEANLAKYLENSIKKVCEYLEIKTEIIISSSIEKDNNLRAEEKVIEICKKIGATEYYNAVGGQELYSYDDFKNNGITLKFLKTNDIKYNQFNNEFISNLSIVDVLMFNSKEKIMTMLDDYNIIQEN
ncbi:WbqC family protein [Clostridium chrysemydis]|uniref:WbqC family protein n=1 Tax=Clostridium chrysemydis TaxID=2665504 RepID=UPI00188339C4|nr:WbqC family protein [Clostridium chrysemydis]